MEAGNFEWATKVTREKMSPPSTFDITSLTQTSVKKNQSFLHWKCNFCSKFIKLSFEDFFDKLSLFLHIPFFVRIVVSGVELFFDFF